MAELALSKGQVNACLRPMLSEELIEVKGLKPLDRGFGNERIFGLAVKKIAVNAFDWRNLDTPPLFSARDIQFGGSLKLDKKEDRVVVYSRA
jgi:hypothetical protein